MKKKSFDIRAHHLLCLHGFKGLGYSPFFVSTMAKALMEIKTNKDILINLVDDVDVLCMACPHLSQNMCCKSGNDSDERIKGFDRKVFEKIGIKPNSILKVKEAILEVQENIRPDDLDNLCKNCEWFNLGYCKEGLKSRVV
ncbi:MAG: DUF1284 domain-containing protein [Actinobacteria bacterium]|nr:DUF1284 domain-containing protein [Actinomycetota bacterium]